jgi:hypothetical protein
MRNAIFSAGAMVLACLLAVLFCTQPAYAYVDPGSGSYLVQLLIAAVVGISFTVRTYWGRIKQWLGRRDEP